MTWESAPCRLFRRISKQKTSRQATSTCLGSALTSAVCIVFTAFPYRSNANCLCMDATPEGLLLRGAKSVGKFPASRDLISAPIATTDSRTNGS